MNGGLTTLQMNGITGYLYIPVPETNDRRDYSNSKVGNCISLLWKIQSKPMTLTGLKNLGAGLFKSNTEFTIKIKVRYTE